MEHPFVLLALSLACSIVSSGTTSTSSTTATSAATTAATSASTTTSPASSAGSMSSTTAATTTISSSPSSVSLSLSSSSPSSSSSSSITSISTSSASAAAASTSATSLSSSQSPSTSSSAAPTSSTKSSTMTSSIPPGSSTTTAAATELCYSFICFGTLTDCFNRTLNSSTCVKPANYYCKIREVGDAGNNATVTVYASCASAPCDYADTTSAVSGRESQACCSGHLCNTGPYLTAQRATAGNRGTSVTVATSGWRPLVLLALAVLPLVPLSCVWP